MKDGRLLLARDDTGAPEIFHSVQGEGPSLGAPRTFIRLSGCNLHCVWCDTAYTWNWQGSDFVHLSDGPETPAKFDRQAETAQLSVNEAADLVAVYDAPGIVITGGEPLMQRAQLPALIDAVRARAGTRPVHVEIETNGSILPPAALIDRVDQFNVSPKLSHSGNDARIARNPDTLRELADLSSAFFKFVISAPGDLDEVEAICDMAGIAASRVWLMPLGTTSADVRGRLDMLVPLALERGYYISDRLHIHLFGDKRGV